jgi:hypothetical protein
MVMHLTSAPIIISVTAATRIHGAYFENHDLIWE